MPRKKRAKPELRVVFDTSVLFTQVASDLVRGEVRQLIEANSRHVDLNIRWYLPNVVVHERRYQMQRKAFEFLPSIAKLEKLLGHNLNITEDILTARVDEAITRQLEELGILKLEIDTTTVDWPAIIERAAYRSPPFEPGEKEKGFRDSLIAESFLQLLKESPVTPSVCRLALVTGDGLLAEYVKENTKEARNVRVLANIDELESLINTLVSQVTEEFVAEVREKVGKYFYEKDNEASLFHKERIWEKIYDSYREELEAVPTEGLLRENGIWWIGASVFVRKKQQRIWWITSITISAKLLKYEFPEQTIGGTYHVPTLGPTPSGTYHLPTLGPTPSVSFGTSTPGVEVGQRSLLRGFAATLFAQPTKKVEVDNGQSRFEIHWSVNITQTRKLTSPVVEKIEFVGTKWGEE